VDERVENFLRNWIDANIVNVSHEPSSDPKTMQYRYLTDAVAAGIGLDDVNAEWHSAEVLIARALSERENPS
jgi:hypothetical protein